MFLYLKHYYKLAPTLLEKNSSKKKTVALNGSWITA